MKKAREWVDEMSQSGAFDLIDGMDEAEMFIRKVQSDAYMAGENFTIEAMKKVLGDEALENNIREV